MAPRSASLHPCLFAMTPERAEPLQRAFAPCRVASIEAGVFAANEQPDRYAQAVLDYLRNPP
jgi:hypothetical protein